MKKFQKLLIPVLAVVLLCLGVKVCRVGIDALRHAEYPQKYQEYVEYYAGKYSLDPLLLCAFIRTESGFDPDVRSSVDARGLMQLTEETFAWIKSKIAPTEDITFDDLFDPETNIRFGTYYLCCCLQRYNGDISTAAAAYHSGWGTVDGLLKEEKYSPDGQTLTVFPYTRMNHYVEKIQDTYRVYQKLYQEDGQA